MVAGYYGVDLGPLLQDPAPQASPASELVPGCKRSPRPLHLGDARLHGGRLGRDVPAKRQPLSGPQTGALSRCDPHRLRPGAVGDGAFYCPADSTVYIDLSFYQDMRDKLGPTATSPRAM